MTDDQTTVVHNEAKSRFEIAVGTTRAGVAEYVDVDGRRVFTHTEIDDAFSGQGLASVLVRQALEATKEAGLRIVAVCPYVKKYVGKHKQYAGDVDAPHAGPDQPGRGDAGVAGGVSRWPSSCCPCTTATT